MHALLHSVSPTLQQANPDPCLHWGLLDTHRQVWVSLLWGHCSFLLGPSAHKILFMPSKSLFPQSYVSSGSSMVGLMVTSSKKAMPYPGLLHPESMPLQQAMADLYLHRRHSDTQQQVWLSLCVILVCTGFCLSFLSISGHYGV